MQLEIGHYYQNRAGKIVKIVAEEQKPMRARTEQFWTDLHAGKIRPEADDQEWKPATDCYLCWPGGEEDDYYVLASGQACEPYKLVSGDPLRWAYPLPEAENQADLVREVFPKDAKALRYYEEQTFKLTPHVALALRVRARNADLAYDQLPPISAIEEALRPLFASSSVEVEDVFYDYDAGDLESEDDFEFEEEDEEDTEEE